MNGYSFLLGNCQANATSYFTQVQEVRQLWTDECYSFNNADPCCNPNLRLCCAPRFQSTTIQRLVVKNNSTCALPVQAVMDYTNYAKKSLQLQSSFQSSSYDETRAHNIIQQCAFSFASTAVYCGTNDATCLSGMCNRNTGYCEPPADILTHFYPLLAACISSSTIGSIVMKKALNLPVAATNVEFAAALKTMFERPQGTCMRLANAYLGEPTQSTQLACDNYNRRCMDNTNPPCGQMKCMSCSPFSSTCTSVSGYGATNCSTVVQCFTGSSSSYMAKDICLNTSTCTNNNCYSNPPTATTQSTCNSTGYCSYAASCVPVCLHPATTSTSCSLASKFVNNTYISCSFNTAAGSCFCSPFSAAITSAQCTAMGGTLNSYISQNACNSLGTICSRKKLSGATVAQDLPVDECTKCNGSFVPKYTFVANTWSSSYALGQFEWRENKNWTELMWMTPGFDYSKYKSFVRNAFVQLVGNQTQAYFKSIIASRAEYLRRILCNCAGGSTFLCYTPIKNLIAKVNAAIGSFSYVSVPNEGSITISPSSYTGTTGDLLSIDVSKTELEPTPTLTRQAAVGDYTLYDSFGTAIGQVVSNGLSISPAPTGNVNLCINIDTSIAITNPNHVKPAFAMVTDSGKYIYVASVAATESSGSICGSISNSNTYFAARMSASYVPPNPPQPQPPQPKPSPVPSSKVAAAPMMHVSLFAMLLVFCIMLLA